MPIALHLQVPPIEYFKHVILELKNDCGSKAATHSSVQQQHQPSGGSPSSTYSTSACRPTVRGLQKRFDEVSLDLIGEFLLVEFNCNKLIYTFN